jgi:hypothetical protein
MASALFLAAIGNWTQVGDAGQGGSAERKPPGAALPKGGRKGLFVTGGPGADIHPATRSALESGHHTFVVTNRAGMPIVGATAYTADSSARISSKAGRSRSLGQSNSKGEMQLAEIHLPSTRTFVIEAEHYVPFVAREFPKDEVTQVTLEESSTQVFRCVDDAGRPVAGVSLLASQVAFRADEVQSAAFDHTTPGPDPLTALHSGVSDSSGVISLDGLSGGRYCYFAQKNGFGSATSFIPFSPSTNPIDIVFNPARAIVLRPLNDKVVSWTARIPTAGPFLASAARESATLARELERRFPGAIVVVSFSKDIEASPLEISMLLERSGVRRVEAAFHSILDSDLEEIIDTEGATPSSSALIWRTCTVRVQDTTNTEVNVSSLSIDFHPDQRSRFSIPIVPGTPTLLPVGAHEFHISDPMIRQRGTIVIGDGEGQSILISLPYPFRPVKVKVVDEDNMGNFNAFLTFTNTDRSGQLFFDSSREKAIFLPAGSISISANVFGFKIASEDFFVRPDSGHTIQEFVIHVGSPR